LPISESQRARLRGLLESHVQSANAHELEAIMATFAARTKKALRHDHVRDLLGFPGTGREVEMHYAAFYRFDVEGKLVSERIVMDWSPLVPSV